jgi:hypothetical protein
LGSEAAQSTKTSLVQDKELGGHATLINLVWSLDSGLHGNLSLSQFYVQAKPITLMESRFFGIKPNGTTVALLGLAWHSCTASLFYAQLIPLPRALIGNSIVPI